MTLADVLLWLLLVVVLGGAIGAPVGLYTAKFVNWWDGRHVRRRRRRVPSSARSHVIDCPDLLPGVNPPSALLFPSREDAAMGQHLLPAKVPVPIVGPPQGLRTQPERCEAPAFREAMQALASTGITIASPYQQARRDYIRTGDMDAYAAMLEHVTLEDK